MYAVIETGGKQYKVQEGDVLRVEKLGLEPGEKVVFDKVLAMSTEEGMKVGHPYVDGASVFAEVTANGKEKKVVIFKYKAKKDYRKKQGHRQNYTEVEIKSLGGNGEQADEEAPKKVSASMKKDELIAAAKEQGVDVDEKATKAEIIEAIEAAEK